jgi:hypothetical protein
MSDYALGMFDDIDREWSALASPRYFYRTEPAQPTIATQRVRKTLPVRVSGLDRLPPWFDVAMRSIAPLLALPPNWDSYGGQPIDPKAAMGALQLLMAAMKEDKPMPQFVPVSNGGVMLEWHTMNGDLEIEVMPSGYIRAVFDDAAEWEEPIEIAGIPGALIRSIQEWINKV